MDNFEEYYNQALINLGYEPHYAQKIGRKEGSLLAFKTNKFALSKKTILQFNEINPPKLTKIKPKMLKKILKPNNNIILELECKND